MDATLDYLNLATTVRLPATTPPRHCVTTPLRATTQGRSQIKARTVAYFNENHETEIFVHESPVGLGAILTQKAGNGESHTIAYGWKQSTNSRGVEILAD